MGFLSAYEEVKGLFTEAIEVGSLENIQQNGVYIILGDAKPKNARIVEMRFSIVVAQNSYSGERGALAYVDELTTRAIRSSCDVMLTGVQNIGFNGALVGVAISFQTTLNLGDEL